MANSTSPSARRRSTTGSKAATRSTRRRAQPRARRRSLDLVDKDGRDRIVAVAIRSFSEVGYEGTTTAGVAREAGVTQPLIHHHFGSKEGLWRAAMDELFSEVRAFTVPRAVSPTDRILGAAEQFVRFVAAHPEVTRVIAREGAAPSPRLTYLVDRYLRQPFREMANLVRTGQRAGLLAPHVRPDLALFFMLGAGSYLFDVTALAQESFGVDATSAQVREDFVVLVREVLRGGLFRKP
jgi:AcrR family transcriptional regulator